MTINKMLLLFASLFALSTSGFAQTVTADGHVVYKMPEGELVTRDVALEVPMRGEGDVFLLGGGQRVKAAGFKAKEENGRMIFAIAFVDPPGAPAGTIGVFHGTVLHGTNQVIYYGDIYKLDSDKGLTENWDDVTHDVTYLGGFHFMKDVKSDLQE